MKSIRVLVSALTLQSAVLVLRAQSPVIYSFGGDPDGANPKRSVTLSGSSLCGTTVYGGTGDGTVFQLLSSSGSWSETVLYSFAGGTGDGSEPRVVPLTAAACKETSYDDNSNDYPFAPRERADSALRLGRKPRPRGGPSDISNRRLNVQVPAARWLN
jgi:hypothetical protein